MYRRPHLSICLHRRLCGQEIASRYAVQRWWRKVSPEACLVCTEGLEVMDCDGNLCGIVRISFHYKSRSLIDPLNAVISQRWAPLCLLVVPTYHPQPTGLWKHCKQSSIGTRIRSGLSSPVYRRVFRRQVQQSQRIHQSVSPRSPSSEYGFLTDSHLARSASFSAVAS